MFLEIICFAALCLRKILSSSHRYFGVRHYCARPHAKYAAPDSTADDMSPNVQFVSSAHEFHSSRITASSGATPDRSLTWLPDVKRLNKKTFSNIKRISGTHSASVSPFVHFYECLFGRLSKCSMPVLHAISRLNMRDCECIRALGGISTRNGPSAKNIECRHFGRSSCHIAFFFCALT